jgi:hypothetical protein
VSLLRFILYSLVAYFVLKFVLRLSKPKRPASRDILSSGRMIRCEACGTFVAERGALLLGGQGFCSTACVEKAAKASA